jgi:hypothetical protein
VPWNDKMLQKWYDVQMQRMRKLGVRTLSPHQCRKLQKHRREVALRDLARQQEAVRNLEETAKR